MIRARDLAQSVMPLAVLLAMAGGTPAAAAIGDLYQAQAIVTGQGEVDRRRGFSLCFLEVMVKVSGDPRLFGDRRVAVMAARAGTFVDTFRSRDRMAHKPINDEQGTRDRPHDLTVDFDTAKIDAALQSLGRKPWTAERPRVVIFVAVDNGAVKYLLAQDGERGIDQRDALAAAAAQSGMPMALPSQSALAAAGLNVGTLPEADAQKLDAAARSAGGAVALSGSLVWSDKALGWIANWRLGAEGRVYRWQIRGVSFDDAFRNALYGAAQVLSGNGAPQ